MTFKLNKIVLTAVLAGALAAGGCSNRSGGSSPQTGGGISPTGPTKPASNLVTLKEGAPTITALVPPGGNVEVRDRSTNQSIWRGTVKPNTVITVAPDGVYIDSLKKMALKNPSAKHAIYYVKPNQ